MNLLLDTHAWLWFVLGNTQLSASARNHILDPASVNFISPASYWEISIKISLGRYTLNANYKQFMRQAIVGNGFRFLHISPRHTEQVSTLPLHHRDPFDRLLIAQAMVEGMAIVSNDGNFAPYGVHVVW
ncbi:MAG: type II toxin-antitoxin system VapC family toxin [Isosphaeraceae bacterium]